MGVSKTFVPNLWGSAPAQADAGCQAPTALVPSHALLGVWSWDRGPGVCPSPWKQPLPHGPRAACSRIVAQGSHLVVAVTHLPAPAETSPKPVPKTHQSLQVLETLSLLG